MAIKKKSVKSKKSVVTKKSAMKKTPVKKTGRGRPKAVAKKAPVKKVIKKVSKKAITKKPAVKKAPAKKAPIKKAVAKKPATKRAASKKKVVRAANPAVERMKALRTELAEVKAQLKATLKSEAGLSKIVGSMSSAIEKSVVKMVKADMASLTKALKSKPRKKRAKASDNK